MSEHSARLKAEFLALVAWADGDFDESERQIFLDVLDRSQVDEDTRIELVDFLDHSPEREPAMGRLAALPLADVLPALRTAWLLAHADGELHPAEQALFDELADRIGLGDGARSTLFELLDLSQRADVLERALLADAPLRSASD